MAVVSSVDRRCRGWLAKTKGMIVEEELALISRAKIDVRDCSMMI
jgi:hypothetical protein